jgi:hypothetical protein
MSTIRALWSESDLGHAGWKRLHERARQRHRSGKDEALALLLFALDRDLSGEDTELSQNRLDALLGVEPLEPVA